MIKTVFFGTHHFATHILQALIDDPTICIDVVITQPDKPVGRKKVMTAPPVKILAEKHGITVDQPSTLKIYELPTEIDLGITAQYGLLVPQHILDTPKKGILNVHTSLLPKYRGASPIQSALIAGDTTTGVTIMRMGVGLDTGPILKQEEISIETHDTYLQLDEKLAQRAAPLLLETISGYMTGEITPQEQDDALATHCKQFKREDGRINWQETTKTIYNQYRGLTPWPGIFTTLDDKRLKLLNIKPGEQNIAPGVLHMEDNNIFIGTTDGSIEIIELQIEGKQAMEASVFASGYQQYQKSVLI